MLKPMNTGILTISQHIKYLPCIKEGIIFATSIILRTRSTTGLVASKDIKASEIDVKIRIPKYAVLLNISFTNIILHPLEH
jgi:hypothetical protein